MIRAQEAAREGDIAALDEIIKNREVSLKGNKRAKINRVGEFNAQSWIGIDRLDYRFTPTRRIIRDIMNAEEVRDV